MSDETPVEQPLTYWTPGNAAYIAYRNLSRLACTFGLAAGLLAFAGLLVRHLPGQVLVIIAAVCIGLGIRAWFATVRLVRPVRETIEVVAEPVSSPMTAVASVIDGRVGEKIVAMAAPSFSPAPLTDDELQERAKRTAIRRVLVDVYFYTPSLMALATMAVISVAHFVWM